MEEKPKLNYSMSTENEAFDRLIRKIQEGSRYGVNKQRYQKILFLLRDGVSHTYDEMKEKLGPKLSYNLSELISKLKGLLTGTGFSLEKESGTSYSLVFKGRSRALVVWEAPATHHDKVLEKLKEINQKYLDEGKDIRIIEAGPLVGIYDLYSIFDSSNMNMVFNEILEAQKIVSDDPVLKQRLRTVTFPIIDKGRWILKT